MNAFVSIVFFLAITHPTMLLITQALLFAAIVNIYDDHEIVNDFNGYSNESAPLWTNASAAWSTYQGNANYDSYAVDSKGHKPHYYEFTYGDVAFFVLDTRRCVSIKRVGKLLC